METDVIVINNQIHILLPNGQTAALSQHAAVVFALQIEQANWELLQRQQPGMIVH